MTLFKAIPDSIVEGVDLRTIEGLKQHILWQQLTDKQKVFVLKYIETDGDRLTSVKAAFDVETDRGAMGMASRLLRNYLIRNLLSAYYGYDIGHSNVSRSELLAIISARLRKSTLPAREFEHLTRMYADIRGWRSNTVIEARNRFKGKDDEVVEEQESTPEDDLFALVKKLEQQKG